jgi:hypothetical protein
VEFTHEAPAEGTWDVEVDPQGPVVEQRWSLTASLAGESGQNERLSLNDN